MNLADYMALMEIIERQNELIIELINENVEKEELIKELLNE
jgi:hypothetical protein